MACSTKIFVGGIPKEVTEDDLCEKVSVYGNVVHVYYDRATERNSRGWAFITYGKIESAYKAITCLHSRRILPNSQWPLEVKFAAAKQGNRSSNYKNNKGCHNMDMTKNNEWQLIKSDVSDYKHNDVGRGRNVYINSSHDVLPCHLNEKEMRLTLRNLTTNLFIFHVPPHWSDQDLYDHFAPFGHVVSAHVQKDAKGRNRGFGFVNYISPISAFSAIKKMNGFHVAGKYLKVQLKKKDEKYAVMGQMLQSNMVQNNIIQKDTVQNTTMMHNTRLQNSVMQTDLMQKSVMQNNIMQNSVIQNSVMQNGVMQNNVMQNSVMQNNVMQNNIIQTNRMQNNRMQNNRMQNNRLQNSSMHSPQLIVNYPSMMPGQPFLFAQPPVVTTRQSNPVPLFTFTPMYTKN